MAGGGRRYDVVFDLAVVHGITGLRRAVTPTGTLVLGSGGSAGQVLGAPVLILQRRSTRAGGRRHGPTGAASTHGCPAVTGAPRGTCGTCQVPEAFA